MKMINWRKGKNAFVIIRTFLVLLFLFTSCSPICTTDVSNKVRIGMPKWEVESLCGSPTHKEISYTLYGTREEWIYRGFFKVYSVVFLDGEVIAIHEKGM